MIAKCIAILAIVAQIYASDCNQQSIVLSASQSFPVNVIASGNSGSSFRSTPVVLVSSENNLKNAGAETAGVTTRNVVAKGKYPVALRNCGPATDKQIPVITSSSTTPVQFKPLVRIPANIPAPRTVSHSCTCYKTIIRPRVHQHIVTVPSVDRYLETTHKPIVENIQYEAVPVNCQSSASSVGSNVQLVSSSGSSAQLISLVPNSQSGSQVIEIPTQSQQIQTIQVPQVQTVDIPQIQTFQAPQVFASSSPVIQTFGSECF